MRINSFVKRNLFLVFFFLVYLLLGVNGIVICPVKLVFDIPCPACGVSRALNALLILQIDDYFHYNMMAVFLVLAVWLALNRDFFSRKKAIDFYIYGTLMVNFIYYFIRVIILRIHL